MQLCRFFAYKTTSHTVLLTSTNHRNVPSVSEKYLKQTIDNKVFATIAMLLVPRLSLMRCNCEDILVGNGGGCGGCGGCGGEYEEDDDAAGDDDHQTHLIVAICTSEKTNATS